MLNTHTTTVKYLLRAVFAVVLFCLALSYFISPATPASSAPGLNEQLNFQARLLTSTGSLVADGDYHIRFKIYHGGDGALGGGDETLDWTETRSTGNLVRVENGYLNVQLGSVNALSGIDWNDDTIWLSMDIGGTGGVASWDGEMDPFIRFTSVPYAFNAKNLQGRDASQFVQLDPGSSAQTVSTANTAINVNQTGAGAILNLQKSGSSKLLLANNGNLTVDTNTLFVNASNNRVGIGTTSPSQKLDVNGDSRLNGRVGVNTAPSSSVDLYVAGSTTTSSGTYWTAYNSLTANPGSNSTAYYYAQQNVVSVPSSNNKTITGIHAASNYAQYDGDGDVSFAVRGTESYGSVGTASSANIANVMGIWGAAGYHGSGTASYVTGVGGNASTSGVGTITEATGLQGSISNNSTGTIDSAFGVYVYSTSNSGGGSITNNYGIYLQDQASIASTLNYNLYSAGAGQNYFGGALIVATLGSADSDTVVCRNTSNQLATCNSTFATTSNAFLQGGNSFSGQAVLGTNDTNSLAFETDGTTRWTIGTTGHLTPASDNTYDIGSSTARVRDLYLGSSSLHVGTSGNEATVSYDTGTNTLALTADNTSVSGNLKVSNLSECDRLTTDTAGLVECSAGADLHINKVSVYGDSYTAGGTAGNPTYFNTFRFTSRLASLLKAQEFNRGINGTTAHVGGTTQGWTKFLQEQTNVKASGPYTPIPGAFLINYGGNDIKYLGNSNTGPLKEALRTIVSRARAGGVFEDSDASVSYSSGWTNNNSTSQNSGSSYRSATTTGKTVTISVPSDFKGGTVALGFITDGNGDGANYSITVDGGGAGSYDTRGRQNSSSGKLGVVHRLTGLSSGSHTIVLTTSSITGTTYFDYWQIESANPPLVVLPFTPKLPSYASFTPYQPTDSDIDDMNSAKTSLVSEFDSSVITVDFDSALNKNTDYFDSDNVHPNDEGHAILAATTYNAISQASTKLSQLAYTAQPSGNYFNNVLFRNNNDSNTGFQVQDSAGIGLLNIDTTNKKVGIGTSSPTGTLTVASSSSSVDRGITVAQYSSNSNGAFFYGRKARGTEANPLAVQNGDNLFVSFAQVYDGTDYLEPSSFGFTADGTVSTGSVPTAFRVLTGSGSIDGGTERLRVTSTGLVGVNTDNPTSQFTVSNEDTAITRGLSVNQHNNGVQGAWITSYKSRGTRTSPTTVANGDALMTIFPWAYDGSNYLARSFINFGIDGAVSTGSTPTAISFNTGTSTSIERLRIASNGNVGVGGDTTPNSLFSVGSTSQFQINTSGTIIAGTWNGGTIGPAYGGTGQTSYTTGDLLYASGATTLSKLAAVASGSCLISQGTSTAPAWGSCGGGSGVTSIGALDGQSKNANAATISGTTLYLQSADGSNPGVVTTTTQTFAGAKTFSGNLLVNGNTTLGDASGDTLAITGTAISAPNNLNFDSDTLFVDAGNNRVGVGTNSPGTIFQVNGTAASAVNGSVSTFNGTLNSSTNTNTNALRVDAVASPGSLSTKNYVGALLGIRSTSTNFDTTASLIGLLGRSEYNGAGTLDNLISFRTDTIVGSGATVNTLRGLHVLNPQNSGTIGDNIGLQVNGLTAGGNNFGIIVGEATGTNQANLVIGQTFGPTGTYSIYNSSSDKNYFAGNLSIGTTNSNEKLNLQGSLALAETTAPSATTGYGKLYVKSSDSLIYFKDDGGTEYSLTAASCSTCATRELDNLQNVAINTHLLPDTDDTYDLGSSSLRWRDLYLGPSSLHIGTNGNEGSISYNTTSNYLNVDAGEVRFTGNVVASSAPSITSQSRTDTLVKDSGNSRVGEYSSMKIGTDGYARIFAKDASVGSIYIQCTNTDCTSSNTNTITTSSINDDSELVLTGSDLAYIVYFESSTSSLVLVQCTNASCSTKNATTLDSAATSAYENSVAIALGSDGFPRIAYTDNLVVTYIQCTNATCSTKNVTSSLGNETTNTTNGSPNLTMALDSSGYGRIAYVSNTTNIPIAYIKCTNASCSTSSTANLFNGNKSRGSLSMALDSNGIPSFSIFGNGTDFEFYRCTNDACSSYSVNVLDDVYSSDDVGKYSRLHIVNSLPLITAQRDIASTNSSQVYIVRCLDIACSQYNSNTVSPNGEDLDDLFVTSALTSNGTPRIAYYWDNKASDKDLRFITCYDLLCNTVSNTVSGGINIGSSTNYFANAYIGNLYAKNGYFNGFDLAENYYVDDTSIGVGDIVAIDHGTTVKKSSSAYDNTVVGVVSTQPGITLSDWEKDDRTRPVALAGRVPVKVTGSITIGDYITASDIPGVGMKATHAGMVVGRALESHSGSGTGTITIFVGPEYYNPSMADLLQATNITLSNLLVTGNLTVEGNLVVANVEITGNLVLGAHVYSRGEVPIIESLDALGQTDTNQEPLAVIDGTDTAGSINLTAGALAQKGSLAKITFSKQYDSLPRIVLSPTNEDGLNLTVFIRKVDGGFEIVSGSTPEPGKLYQFDYIIIGAEQTLTQQ